MSNDLENLSIKDLKEIGYDCLAAMEHYELEKQKMLTRLTEINKYISIKQQGINNVKQPFGPLKHKK